MNNENTNIEKNNLHNPTYQITVINKDTTVFIECREKEKLLDAMTRQDIYVNAVCGKRGTCGKCKIQLLEGTLKITDTDRKAFTEEELRQGYRLSCMAYPESDCTIKLNESDESDFDIVADFGAVQKADSNIGCNYAIAIDIGTTTIAVSLITFPDGKVLTTHTLINRQRAYGADVISRIQASNAGKDKELKNSIQKDLLAGIRAVIDESGVQRDKVQKIAIAGNTTMGHLLLGYSCRTLGSYPFTPVNIKKTVLTFEEVFDTKEMKAPVVLLPGISAFIGGDITAGLLSCEFDKKDKVSLFLDLGTNGEMAVGNQEKILVTSTAAGPAFEGGNISYGVGSIAGAICQVDMVAGKAQYKTIGDRTPVGICGTGVIETVAELYKAGLMDETGLLSDTYFDSGYPLTTEESDKAITFTQKDIREIQLAKAAVRAGIEILIRRYGISDEEIDTVYLAGGFGYKINIRKAVEIGLLPEQLLGKIIASGNTSLSGAIRYLAQENTSDDRMEQIIEVSQELHLSNDDDFNELYIKYMNF